MANKSKVNIIDPNETININHEDLNIYVELSAIRKGRGTVFFGDDSLSTDDDKFRINLLGIDNNSKNFTTNWSNNTPTESKQYEGFGIINIDIKTNASLLPQVTIEFVDIHGLSFFNNNESSPYKVLFDFPPPIFNLKVKGYYGKALSYELHLIKTNVKFNENTGNYHITSDFVARTFAPLTDVLFKYVEIFPLLNGKPVSDITTPSNTHELLFKIKELYDKIGKRVESSEYNKKITEKTNIINDIIDIKNYISRYSNEMSNYDINNKSTIVVRKDKSNDSDGYSLVQTTYDDYITNYLTKLSSDNDNEILESRLLLGILNNGNDESKKKNSLLDFGEKILKRGGLANIVSRTEKISETSPKAYVSGLYENLKFYPSSDKDSDGVKYYFIDISQYVLKLLRVYTKEKNNLIKNNEEFNNEINKLPKEILNFEPNIYNIFKIICDDVDTFFNELNNVVKNARIHHERYKNEINSRFNISDNKTVEPFPVLYELDNNSPVKTRRNKIIPDSVSNGLSDPFPEILLVDKFISKYVDLIIEEKKLNLKDKLDDDKNNVWLPIAPFDSVLFDGEKIESSYANYEKKIGENEIIGNLYNIFLERYYLISQYVYQNKLSNGTITNKQNLIKLLASAEAANIVNSSDKKILLELETISSNGLNQFLNQIKSLNSDLYNNVDPNVINTSDGIDIILNKNSNSFIGTRILEIEDIKEKSIATDVINTSIDKYLQQYNNEDNIRQWFGLTNKVDIKSVTQENLPYIKIDDPNDLIKSDYFIQYGFVVEYKQIYNNFKHAQKSNNNILLSWSNIFDEEYLNIYNLINDSDYNSGDGKIAKALLLLSSFGRIEIPFERDGMNSTEYLESIISYNFTIPSVIDVPNAFILYMGGLCSVINNSDNIVRLIEEIRDKYFKGNNDLIGDEIIFKIKSNIADIKSFLSIADVDIYSEIFNDGVVGSGSNLFGDNYFEFESMIIYEIEKKIDDDVKFVNSLTAESDMIQFLTKRVGLLINNSLAYSRNNVITTFTPLNERSEELKQIDNEYFTVFLSELGKYAADAVDYVTDLENEFFGKIDNNNIRTRIYYSFKNIVDKWIINEPNISDNSPFPSIKNKLIDNFLFVDRAMNDIGGKNGLGSILDINQLLDLSKNLDMNVFSVFSSILSHNNFEFFPIQNFMKFSSDEWNNNSFGLFPSTTLSVEKTPAFVCMYIGGLADILDDPDGKYMGNGIPKLENFGNDFIGAENDSKINNVNAFKVAFGSQNQSIFMGVDIDSEEYPETNESLQILSKIADGDSEASPQPVAQNLFNMYQRRSYSSTITMMGNVMIQPTHYYEISNIPMFNGSYEILNVEHNIKPNHMVTKFNGVKIANFPDPIVTEFSTSLGIGDNITDFITSSKLVESNDDENIVDRISPPDEIPSQANYNSMFNLNIT